MSDRRWSIELIINKKHQSKGKKQAEDKAEPEVVKPREKRFAFFLSCLDFGLTMFAAGRPRQDRFPAKGTFCRLSRQSHALKCPWSCYPAR